MYNIYEFVGSDGTVNSNVVQRAVDTVPHGSTLIFPTSDSYSFGGITIKKKITLDFQNSIITTVNQNTLFVTGEREEKSYVLSKEAKRKEKKIYLTETPVGFSPGDLIMLRDDSSRHMDGNPDQNLEVHEIASVVENENSVLLRDFVRLPKSISNKINLYKIKPVDNVTIQNAVFVYSNGSIGHSPIKAEMTRWLTLKNITTRNTVGSSVAIHSSYGFSISDFNFSNPQRTDGGYGYGIQLFGGVNNYTVSNGYGSGMRHTFDASSSFDGLVENVVAIENKSSQFVMSHNGWGSDVTFFKCRSYGGVSFGFQIASQGLESNFDNVHYGIKIIDCEVEIPYTTTSVTSGVHFHTPVKESLISGFRAVLGDGSAPPPTIDSCGIRTKNIDTDITIRDTYVEGFKKGFAFEHSVDYETTDPHSMIKLKNVSGKNLTEFIAHSYGLGKKLDIDGATVTEISSSLFRLAVGSFKRLSINNIDITNSPNANIFFVKPMPDTNGIHGDIRNISKDDLSKNAPLILSAGQKINRNQIYGRAFNGRLSISSLSDISLSNNPIEDGIIEGEIFSLINRGHFNISIPQASILIIKSKSTKELSAGDSINFQWFNNKWWEV